MSASSIMLGMKMESEFGEVLTVWNIKKVWKTGRYAPHTIHGDLVVNGVVVSAYTTEVHPSIAHALLAPVRLFSIITGKKEPLGAMFYRGGGSLLNWMPRGRDLY